MVLGTRGGGEGVVELDGSNEAVGGRVVVIRWRGVMCGRPGSSECTDITFLIQQHLPISIAWFSMKGAETGRQITTPGGGFFVHGY